MNAPSPGPDPGALVALLHRAMRDAARARTGGDDVAAVDLHVAFVRGASGPVTAAGRVCGGGRTVCFCEAELTDAAGHVVARAMETFRRREP